MYDYSRIEAFAARFYAGFDLLLTPYAYPLTFGALAQNASTTQTINIAANADFIAIGLRHHAAVSGQVGYSVSSKVAPFLRCLITDQGTAEQFTSAAVDLENYSANGVGDYLLPYPRICAGRSALTVQLTNYAGAAEAYTTELNLWGVLVRAYQGGSGTRGAVRVDEQGFTQQPGESFA